MWITKKKRNYQNNKKTDLELNDQSQLQKLVDITASSVVEVSTFYEDNQMYCRVLHVSLCSHDWCKFEKQPFFGELMKYLDNIGIQDSNENVDCSQCR